MDHEVAKISELSRYIPIKKYLGHQYPEWLLLFFSNEQVVVHILSNYTLLELVDLRFPNANLCTPISILRC